MTKFVPASDKPIRRGVRKVHDFCLNSMALLKELHWLPIRSRIEFTVVTLYYKAYRLGTLNYLASSLQPYIPSRMLRSTNQGQLTVPASRIKIASRAFSVPALFLFNKLSASVRTAECELVQVTFKYSAASSIFHVTVELQLCFCFN